MIPAFKSFSHPGSGLGCCWAARAKQLDEGIAYTFVQLHRFHASDVMTFVSDDRYMQDEK